MNLINYNKKMKLSKSINGQRKTVINEETKKEEEIICLYSNSTSNNKSVCEFVLSEKLGEGTFGVVRLAINKQTGEKVAIKILEKSKLTNYNDKNRLDREINILNKIHHPNIVKLFCTIETDRQIFIIMEYIKGNELFQYILVRKKLEEEEAFYFFIQIINCIDYLHKVRIAHRDLKAENIIIEQGTKEIKLIDFGLSNIYEDGQLLSTACGSPCYAAPEMLEGKSYKGSTVDIWSAGVVLYYMLCGCFPFEDTNNEKLYKKICKGKFEIPKFLSKNAKDLISKILVVNIQRRINIKDIKKHPWVLNYLEKDKNYGNIFKHIGLNTNKYIIPIDEDIVNEISTKYNIDKIQIRESILFDIISDVSTLYKLMLNKKCKEKIESVADMKSELYQNYIKDKNNLLSTYNNDLKLVFNKRKNGIIEKEKIMKDSKSYKNIKQIKVDDNNKRIPMPKKSSNCITKNILINKNLMSIKKNKKESAKNLSYKYLTLNDDKNMKQMLIEKKGQFNNNKNENSFSINKSTKKITSKKESNKNIITKKEIKNELIKEENNNKNNEEKTENKNIEKENEININNKVNGNEININNKVNGNEININNKVNENENENEININNNENINIDKKENNENDKNVEKKESNNYESNNLKENTKQKKEKVIPKRNENKENRYYKNYHSNDKIKSNNIMLYKNIKNKINVNTKAIEDKEKELNKLKKEYNNLKVNVIEKDTNNKSYFNTNYNTNAKKKTWNNPIHHKNGTSLIGNNTDNKKKQARRHKNKSMDINDKVANSNYLNKFK